MHRLLPQTCEASKSLPRGCWRVAAVIHRWRATSFFVRPLKSPTKKKKKAVPAQVGGKRSRAEPDEEGKELRGVGAEEWRNILNGEKEHAGKPGLLQEAVTIFTRVNKAHVWAFQCDGASSQSLSQSERAQDGPKNRAAIKRVAPNLVEGWPAHSPDLSPIENVFSRVEWVLWTDP